MPSGLRVWVLGGQGEEEGSLALPPWAWEARLSGNQRLEARVCTCEQHIHKPAPAQTSSGACRECPLSSGLSWAPAGQGPAQHLAHLPWSRPPASLLLGPCAQVLASLPRKPGFSGDTGHSLAVFSPITPSVLVPPGHEPVGRVSPFFSWLFRKDWEPLWGEVEGSAASSSLRLMLLTLNYLSSFRMGL